MITSTFTHSPRMIAACTAALDAEIFYNDAFFDFVIKHMDGFEFEAVLVDTVVVDYLPGAEGYASRKAFRRSIEDRIKLLSRGHYSFFAEKYADESQSAYSIIMSDGLGGIDRGNAFDRYSKYPSNENIIERVVGYEVYTCRHIISDARLIQSNVDALLLHKFVVGFLVRDFLAPGDSKPFSTAVIQSINEKTGTINLVLTKRGSKSRWNLNIGAMVFAERVPNNRSLLSPPVIINQCEADSLF